MRRAVLRNDRAVLGACATPAVVRENETRLATAGFRPRNQACTAHYYALARVAHSAGFELLGLPAGAADPCRL